MTSHGTLPGGVPRSLNVWPRVSLITSIVLSVILVAATLWGWFRLPDEIQAQFNIPQLVTLILFVVVMLLMMLGLGMSRLRADDRGIWMRNGLFTRRFAWHEVRGVRYRPGDPWAFLLLDAGASDKRRPGEKFRRQQIIAIQNPDGARARRAADQLVEMARAHANPDHSAS